MSLQRGANIRGWEGVTRNLASNSQERKAWNFSLFSWILTLLAVGIASLFLSKADIPILAKAILVLGVLLFTLVLISGIYSTMVRRAAGLPQDDDLEAARSRTRDVMDDLVIDAPSFSTAGSMTALSASSAIATARHQSESAEPASEPSAPVSAEPASEPAQPETVASESEGTENAEMPGVRPAGLDAARDGQPDDLTRIKGVGPKLAELCNSLGFYHFDQIAAWTEAEVAWVDQNLEGFKGRVTRDEWVSQAKALAEGESGEMSAEE